MTRAEFQITIEHILRLPPGSLRETDSRATVEQWDSMVDLQILAVVAEEFGIEPEAELMEAETFGDLLRTLEHKQAFAV